MGETIEIRDVDGNLVRVFLHACLSTIGETLQDDGHTRSVKRGDGREVEVRLVPVEGT